jgi:AcrR family transcriptional regulator
MGTGKASRLLESDRFWEICEKAAHIFAQKGFDRTSLDDIAAVLKITKPGLYYYFSSKDELLYTIIEFYWEKLYQGFKNRAVDVDDPLEMLRYIIANHLRFVITNREASLLVEEKYALREDYRKAYEKKEKEYADAVRDEVLQLQRKGLLRADVDATVVTYSLFSLINMVHRWYNPKGRIPPEKYIRQITDMFLHGLVPPAKR